MKYMKLGSKPDVFQTEGNNIRFVATELATDIIVNVGDVKFYLHKFPLLSKSSRMQKLVAAANEENNDEIDLTDIPGGLAAFEICAKFCYGMIVTLNAYNVVAARCAAEYLEMHENMERGNLIYKIEVFLNSSIFRSWKDSIIVLQTTKLLLPLSEDLKVVSHCIDSIASKASIDPSEVEWSYTYNRKKLPSENGLDAHWNGVRKQQTVPKDWWVEDLCELEMDFYKRVIIAIKNKGRMSGEVIGEALKAYAYRRLSGFSKCTVTHGSDAPKSQAILETIVWLLPTEAGSVSCNFLLRLLRAACSLDCEEMSKKQLIKRIGFQLEEASVSDLLIPAAAEESTIYDIDMVLSIVEEFIMQDNSTARTSPQAAEELLGVRSPAFVSGSSKLAVAKLVDGYLAEIAKDPNLPLSKFVELAEMVSAASRPVHDGLYRAIDMYLKEHPGLAKSEKKKICGLMDCKKLSVDASMHAVQNDRLPLRVVVQVLFFEQLRATAAAPAGNGADIPRSARLLLPPENGTSYASSRSAAMTNTEDDWDGAVGDVSSLKSMSLVRRGGGSERSSGSNEVNKNGDEKGNGKVKGILMPKKILGKLWSSKGQGGESSNSDTSDSPGSINLEESKSTPSRNTRRSVS
ncbi:BTB/POZ domain-containing protein NPY4-like [Phoenix dactylifera]|uniref:BTB/POZ domain-containing protein NPY4-like n=1 Tax=Phoenix dactylifera TaxID=42345 RepID=A0A8B7C645_PHODC|nr:BTB/POZ domain-containing protein NPY4-like [Phoenix dactylifera]XP_008792562.2 BTB/POZ domain-containing protein NPY4-like [Phoenix dactylifera]XP_026661233.2 BTB/POZ domain-containing protein NPY4-like [Phoenix dactylifera]XP_038970291.1 BTB/POZ domain-containing protein NPY4-like [Phoenix dactylifera]